MAHLEVASASGAIESTRSVAHCVLRRHSTSVLRGSRRVVSCIWRGARLARRSHERWAGYVGKGFVAAAVSGFEVAV